MPPSSRPARFWVLRAGLVVAALVCVFTLVLLGLTRQRPDWWCALDAADPRTAETARAVENGVQTVLSRVRGRDPADPSRSEPWSVSLKAADANAWLNARLPKWVENQTRRGGWPEQIREVQVEFRDGHVLIGARVRSGDGDRVLAAVLRPRIDPDGSLWIPATRLALGRLSVPASWVFNADVGLASLQVPAELRELTEARGLFGALAGIEAVSRTASLRLADGRRVRVRAINAHDGLLDLTFTTETR
ncbi:MAG: hypothetical protein JNM07_11980 [Phycisphaerae bacterium]|nr:hypothetical protein [Phycisphaerae bacterium]